MIDTSPLTWWRRRKPQRLSERQQDQLLHCLLTLTDVESDAQRALVARVVADDCDAAFQIGTLRQFRLSIFESDDLSELARDVSMSWLYLAACGRGNLSARQVDASYVLACELIGELEDFLFNPRYRRHVRMNSDDPGAAFGVRRRAVLAFAYMTSVPGWRTSYDRDIREAGLAGRSANAAEGRGQSEARTGPQDHRPTLQVIRAEKLPQSGRRDDRDFVKAYENMLGEVPLANSMADPDTLASVLSTEFPWAVALAQRVRQELQLRKFAGQPWFRLRPVLLVGPPGTGKTRIARRLSELVGTGYDQLSIGGASDARHLLGTARGWSTAQPCAPMMSIRRHSVANPIITLDEIDKAGGDDRNGRVHDALLGMLEPESAANWFDDALGVAVDISEVSWILTANDVADLPAPLRSRLSIVQIAAPRSEHLDAILLGLARDLAVEMGVRPEELPQLDAGAHRALEVELRRHGDVRRLRRAYERAVAAAAGTASRTMH